MNATEKTRFRALIMDRLEALKAEDELGAAGQATVELDQQAFGRLSRMDAMQNQAMAQAGGTRRKLERTRLEAALLRLDDGAFGYCADCGEAIAPGRLKLAPAAQLCIACATG